ncbi:MAG: polysaccharide deacetylase family protein [Bacilli bacterium]|nr:polysaccharide deacetylase family protein [Bacilli bacterium]
MEKVSDILIEDIDDNKLKKKKESKKEKEKKLSKKKKVIIILSLIFLFIAITVLLYILVFDKKVYLEGFIKEDKILVNEEYKDKEFSICYGTIVNCKNVKYETDGEVDTKKIGDYTLTYKYKIKDKEEKLERKVIVYDDVKPEITIDEELAFCKNGKVGKGKYTANDNYDGDITDKVKLSIEGDKSYLEVTDSSGNKESIEVNALEFTSDPVITLKGNSNMYLTVGSTYTESGASATDVCDGDISDKIVISGSVNTSAAGTYTVTYSVENSEGKKTETTRKVVVQVRSAVASGSSCNNIGAIYLTFDDGPQSGSTEKILNILRDEGVKATFFVTSNGPDSLIKREYDEGHVVALHTSTHNYAKIYSSVDAYFNDLYTVQNRVKNITGYEAKIIRFPGGSSNTISRNYQRGIMTTLTSQVLEKGFRYHDWNVDSGDAGACAKTASSACVYSYVTSGLSKSRCNMVLMHDIKNYTANALSDIIHFGKENGYTFDVITMDTPMVTQKVNN